MRLRKVCILKPFTQQTSSLTCQLIKKRTMLNKIIRFSLENRILVLVASVLLVIGGLYSTSKTDVDVFPDLNAPTVVIMTEAGGMATEEVEQLVTFPIETAVNGSTGVRRTHFFLHF